MTARFRFDVDAALARVEARLRGEEASVLSHPSQMSHVASPLRPVPRDLSPAERDAYEERAAVIEFDGGLPRAKAEALAADEVLGERRGNAGGDRGVASAKLV